jgi:hypothetical protein
MESTRSGVPVTCADVGQLRAVLATFKDAEQLRRISAPGSRSGCWAPISDAPRAGTQPRGAPYRAFHWRGLARRQRPSVTIPGVGSSWNLHPRSSVVAAVAAVAAVALVLAVTACGSTAQTGTAGSTASTTTTASQTGTTGSLIPKAHPRAVEPKAGSDPSVKTPTGSDPVGDPTAHAQPLSEVKRELAKLNLCGGTNDPAQATPFSTAHGPGFVADPGTVQDVGELPVITHDLDELGIYLHVTIYGISGYRTPAHSVAVGGYADDPHTKGEAEDIGVNSLLRVSAAQITEADLAKFGLYRPFDPTDDADNTEVNHVQLIPHGGPVPVTVVDDTFDPDPSCK